MTVMADFVSGREDALDRFRIALCRPAGDEERRGHIQLFEQPEDARHADDAARTRWWLIALGCPAY